MDTVELGPQVVANHARVAFWLMHRDSIAECVITTATLEAYFWQAPGATDAQILKTFLNGYSRVRAIAERKLLARSATRLELNPSDFARASHR